MRLEHFAAAHSDLVGYTFFVRPFQMAGRTWQFRIEPNGREYSKKDFVAYYLELDGGDTNSWVMQEPVRAQFKIVLQDTAQVNAEDLEIPRPGVEPRHEIYTFRNNFGVGYDDLLSREKALRACQDDGTLIFHIRVRVFGVAPANPPRGNLVADVSSLRGADGADVTLRAGDSELSAHAFVLSMRSPVLKAMLGGDMREAKSRVIDLKVDEEVAQAFLTYIYSDELDVKAGFSELCCHLLKLAQEFEVRGLAKRCAAALAAEMDVASALERLMLADELGLEELRTACVSFLTRPANLQAAQESEAWERLVEQRPKLMAHLLRAMAPPPKRQRTSPPRPHSPDWKRPALEREPMDGNRDGEYCCAPDVHVRV